MSPLFSVTKFLSKTRSRSSKRASQPSPSQTQSQLQLVGEKPETEKRPLAASSSSQIVVVEPPPGPSPLLTPQSEATTIDTDRLVSPKLDTRTETGSDAVSSMPTIESFKTSEEKNEAGPLTGSSFGDEDHDYAVVQQPEPKSSDVDVDWTQLDSAGQSDTRKELEQEERGEQVAATQAGLEEGQELDDDDAQTHIIEQVVVPEEEKEQDRLRAEMEKCKEELHAVSQEKDTLANHVYAVETDLRKALEVVAAKTNEIDRLLARVDSMNDEIEALGKEKDELQQKAEEEQASVEAQLEREKEEIRREAEQDKHTSTKEIQRLKGLIAVERYRSQERAKALVQEKDGLLTELEVQQDRTAGLVTKLEAQQEHISSLEVRLEDSREETRELYSKHDDVETKLKHHEVELSEERDRVQLRESNITILETNNADMSSQLVQLQGKVNEVERKNGLLLDQLRQQADQLQNRSTDTLSRFSNAPSLSNFTRSLRKGAGACGARAEGAVKALKLLNDEIYQVSASLTDQLEDMNKRFVDGDTGTPAKAEYLKSVLGLELVRKLERDAPYPMEDINPFFIQVGLQGCLTAYCMRIITSWYPTEWEYGSFLEVVYERIKGTDGLENALSWRKTAQQNCLPSIPRERNTKLVDSLMDEIRTVLAISGWTSKESGAEEMLDSFRQKLFNIVALAIRLNTLTAAGVPGELEPILTERSSLFDSRKMVDDCSPERSRTMEMVPQDELVLCVVGLGLRWADNSDVDMPQLLLKPRVLLDSALY